MTSRIPKTRLSRKDQTSTVIKAIQAVQGAKFYGGMRLSFSAGNLEKIVLEQSLLPDAVYAQRSLIVTLANREYADGTQATNSETPQETSEQNQISTGE